jgi:hypothetical protein
MRTVVVLAAALGVSLALAQACSHESKGGASSDPVASGGAPTGKGPAQPTAGGDDKNDSSFNLQVASPDAVKAGAECVAHVTVTPGSGYHVNQEFPTKLVVTPIDGVTVAKAEQHKEDAAAFSETKLQFDVKMTPAKAGTYKVAALLKFAVCTESSCDPKKREIAFDVAAN